MPRLPVSFRKGSSPIQANFDFTDVASGIGYVRYNTLEVYNNLSTDYKLTPDPIRPQNTTLTISLNGGSTQTRSYDSSEFDIQRRVKGKAFFVTRVAYTLGQAGQNGTFTVSINKVSGTTETEIGTVALGPYNSSQAEDDWTASMEMTETTIRRGDLLRIKLVFTQAGSGGSNSTWTLTSNPQSDNTGTYIYIPFEIT